MQLLSERQRESKKEEMEFRKEVEDRRLKHEQEVESAAENRAKLERDWVVQDRVWKEDTMGKQQQSMEKMMLDWQEKDSVKQDQLKTWLTSMYSEQKDSLNRDKLEQMRLQQQVQSSHRQDLQADASTSRDKLAAALKESQDSLMKQVVDGMNAHEHEHQQSSKLFLQHQETILKEIESAEASRKQTQMEQDKLMKELIDKWGDVNSQMSGWSNSGHIPAWFNNTQWQSNSDRPDCMVESCCPCCSNPCGDSCCPHWRRECSAEAMPSVVPELQPFVAPGEL